MRQEMDRCVCANADAVADCFDEERAETQGEALNLPICLHTPTLTYGHERRVVTERTRLHIQASRMSFLRRVAGLRHPEEGWSRRLIKVVSRMTPLRDVVHLGEGPGMEHPAEPAATTTQASDKRQKLDGWTFSPVDLPLIIYLSVLEDHI